MNNPRNWAIRIGGVALALVVTVGAAWGQDQSRLTGSVLDTTGAAIPGARAFCKISEMGGFWG